MWNIHALTALAALTIGLSVLPAGATQAPAAPVTNGYNPTEHEQQQQALYDRLWSKKLPVDGQIVLVELSQEEEAEIRRRPTKANIKSPLDTRQRVGIVRSVSRQVDFRALNSSTLPRSPEPAAGGVLVSRPGSLSWTAAVTAKGANAVRLQFASLNLPSHAALYVFNDEGQVDGPYTGTGPRKNGSFWTHTLKGETVYLQLEFDEEPGDEDLRRLQFVITSVAHIGPLFEAVNLWQSCQANAACVQRVDDTADAAVDEARKAVAHMQFASGPYIYICTGGLLNDRDPNTERNYFLTANHCISKSVEASSLETFFQYTQCGTGADAPLPTLGVGAQLLAGSRTSDFTLLELDGVVPDGSSRLGWNDNQVARKNNEPLFRISHPSGAPQSYSEHSVDTRAPTCRSWPRGSWIYSRDTRGATEGGSSGSPVLNSSGQVVGQLSGACGYAVTEVCDRVSNATVDGAFAAYFPSISEWLDPAPGQTGNQPPTASFSYIATGLNVQFTDTSTDPDGAGDITLWQWDLGDGNVLSDQNPEHRYAEAGSYTVSLTVTDSSGDSDTSSSSVAVSDGSGTGTLLPVSVTSLEQVATCDARGRWELVINIKLDPAIGGFVVTGSWSGDIKGSASCTTDASGVCQVDKKSLKNNATAIFTIDSVDGSGYTYSANGEDVIEVRQSCP